MYKTALPSLCLALPGLGYRGKSGSRFAHKIQTNVSNLWDVRYTYGSTGHRAGGAYVFTCDLNF